jgi:hypothetical protein
MNYVLIIEREGNDDQLAALSVHKTLKAAEAALLRYVSKLTELQRRRSGALFRSGWTKSRSRRGC